MQPITHNKPRQKQLLVLGWAVLSLSLSACQHIQMAESPIPVTADKKNPPVQHAQVDYRHR